MANNGRHAKGSVEWDNKLNLFINIPPAMPCPASWLLILLFFSISAVHHNCPWQEGADEDHHEEGYWTDQMASAPECFGHVQISYVNFLYKT